MYLKPDGERVVLPLESSEETRVRRHSDHASDCSSHEDKACDCGPLELAAYGPHSFVATRIASTGRFGFFLNHMGRERFIEPEQLPTLTLAAIAAASNLIDAHDAISVLRHTDSVDFHDARITIIAKLKTLPCS